jgi:hypothetical protein
MGDGRRRTRDFFDQRGVARRASEVDILVGHERAVVGHAGIGEIANQAGA